MQFLHTVFRFLIHKVALIFVANAIVIGVPLAAISSHVTDVSTVKNWLSESDTYQSIITQSINLVEQTKGDESETIGDSIADNSRLNEQRITEAVAQAIQPEDLQVQVEGALDNTYSWLDGSTDELAFEISIAPEKTQLKNNLVAELSSQLADLPTCTPDQVAANTDIITAICLPAGESVDSEVSEYVDSVLASEGFLGDAAFTSDDIEVSGADTQKIQSSFSTFSSAGIITLALLIVAAPILVLSTKGGFNRGIHALGFALLSPSFFMGIASFIASRITTSPFDFIQQSNASASQIDAVKSIIEPLSLTIINDISSQIFTYSVVLFVIGLILALVAWKFKDNQTPATTNPDSMLSNASDPDPKIWDGPAA